MTFKNGVNPPGPNPSTNTNFSLLSVLRRERLIGPNYMDWMRNLRFTLRYENKEYVIDEQILTINDDSTQEDIEAHQKHYDDASKMSCIMASSMSPELQKTFENTLAYEMNQQIKEMFQAKASKERLDVVKSLMACKPKHGVSICAFILYMKGYFDRKKTLIMKIHNLLQTAEQGIKKSDVPSTLAAHVLTVGHNAKKRKTSHSNWKGKSAQGKSDRRRLKHGKLNLVTENRKITPVTRIGKYELMLKSRVRINLNNCCYSSEMTRNIISFHALFKDGYQFSFDNENGDILVYSNATKDGKRYYVTFTDDFSRYGYVYLIKHKSDTFEVFKRHQNKVENQLGRKIKLTPPRTPQLNGIGERRNRTLLDMVRSMMCRETLPISLWGYALETAAHILYLVSTKKVSKIHFEMWKGKSPSLGHIKIWGCEDSGSKINLKEIQESADKEPIVNTDTQQEVVAPVEHDDIFLPIRKTSSREAMASPEVAKWKEAMKSEIQSMYDNQMDVKTTFLNGKLKEDVFMAQPEDDELDKMSRVLYASAIRSIMYAMTCTRPDISFALSMVSRHQQNPSEGHWTTVKNIIRCLRNTKDMFLVYGREKELRVIGYCDAGWQTDKDDSRSQSGWVFLLDGGAVTWKSSKQDTVTDSTCESEYIEACEASKEAIWMKNFIGDLGVFPTVQDPIKIFCDNESAVALTKEPKDHKKSKHIERKYHFVQSKVEEGHIIMKDIRSEDNPADPFTKALAKSKHDEHAKSIGLKDKIEF
uniref:Retrotransposon protein, putative, Ty1-copia subclass n=1 Tax=Tanacetum cinerariifolium TaxID=118510 RepID=A0A6L2JRI3_TANCI|nr:retrotransposon protein, putative, Ty1-copia subclass [Tanacetum cinerariifolium]